MLGGIGRCSGLPLRTSDFVQRLKSIRSRSERPLSALFDHFRFRPVAVVHFELHSPQRPP